MKKSAAFLIVGCAVLAMAAGCIAYLNSAYYWSGELVSAIRAGNTETALELIDQGAAKGFNMDTHEYPETVITKFAEMDPRTPLRVACSMGNYEVAERLLQNGASANGYKGLERLGRSPVFEVILGAYSPTDLPLLQLLHAYGASFDADEYDGAPIVSAVKRSSLHVHDSFPSMSSEEITQGIAEIFVYLSQYTDCNVLDGGRRNALHNAAWYENWYLCEILVQEYGFSIDMKDSFGKTPYDYAVESAAPDYILALLQP